MATDRPRIQGYIDPALHDCFVEWKLKRGIAKDSEALNQLLAEYFGFTLQSPIPNSQPSITIEQIEEMIEETCQPRFAEMKAYLESKLPTKPEINVRIDKYLKLELEARLNNLVERLEAVEDSLEVVLGKSLSPESDSLGDTRSPELLDADEAPGLSESDASNQDLERDTEEELEESSLVTELSGEFSGDSPKLSEEDLVKLLSPLTQSELAKRLGIHKSTISHRKEGADFEEWTRRYDPDAIAWRYDHKNQRFIPVS